MTRSRGPRRPTKTQRMRTAAKENAEKFGPINPVEPAGGFNEFGEPRLGADQVLVTKTRTAFHNGWCRIVVDIDDPTRFTVIHRDTVGARRLCRTCRNEGLLR